MTDLHISFPDPMREYIDDQVASGRYNTVSEYLQALVREDQKRKAQERLEALLLEGLESGSATVMTDDDSPGVLSRIEVVEPPYMPP